MCSEDFRVVFLGVTSAQSDPFASLKRQVAKEQRDAGSIWILGGTEVYRESFPMADEFWATHVHAVAWLKNLEPFGHGDRTDGLRSQTVWTWF